MYIYTYICIYIHILNIIKYKYNIYTVYVYNNIHTIYIDPTIYIDTCVYAGENQLALSVGPWDT